jgi:ascorbate-specific PTS system EIIC-type component UlaA
MRLFHHPNTSKILESLKTHKLSPFQIDVVYQGIKRQYVRRKYYFRLIRYFLFLIALLSFRYLNMTDIYLHGHTTWRFNLAIALIIATLIVIGLLLNKFWVKKDPETFIKIIDENYEGYEGVYTMMSFEGTMDPVFRAGNINTRR